MTLTAAQWLATHKVYAKKFRNAASYREWVAQQDSRPKPKLYLALGEHCPMCKCSEDDPCCFCVIDDLERASK